MPDILFHSLIFLLGLMAGSLLNCLIYRLESEGGLSLRFFAGRSFCPSCKRELSWQDLFPVLSFVFLGGKCRYCREPISRQEPLVELASGFLFLLLSLFHLSLFHFIVSFFLLGIFVFDLKHYIIPDEIVYPALGTAFLYSIVSSDSFLNPFLAALAASLFFLAIVLVSRGRWMGVGDIKLAFLMGLVLGFPHVLVALFSAFFSGAAIGLGLVFLRKKRLSSEIPFGPFLVAGTFLAMFLGQEILSWYLTFFLIK